LQYSKYRTACSPRARAAAKAGGHVGSDMRIMSVRTMSGSRRAEEAEEKGRRALARRVQQGSLQETTTMGATVDTSELEAKVKEMYRAVATNPRGEFHFEMGRAMAERLGYAPALLDRVPPEAIDSFAGVGHFFDLAELVPGETVADFGSGSGMDTFVAST
jgi:hypothetical protein